MKADDDLLTQLAKSKRSREQIKKKMIRLNKINLPKIIKLLITAK